MVDSFLYFIDFVRTTIFEDYSQYNSGSRCIAPASGLLYPMNMVGHENVFFNEDDFIYGFEFCSKITFVLNRFPLRW